MTMTGHTGYSRIDVFKTDEMYFSFIEKNSLTLFPVLVKTSKYGNKHSK